ncbi:MAG: hypothetical protein M1832_003078 [Thelocarpon impressellum]|nr:MAG: hypothetical protein M1832_003078 [Thelocarpon impressellum]
MEGFLLTPPERTPLLGRSAWKTRFVVFSMEASAQSPRTPPQSSSGSRFQSSLKQLKLASRNCSLVDVSELGPDTQWLSIYKQRVITLPTVVEDTLTVQGDSQPLARYAVSSMRSCTVENLAYRKSTCVQPTLILHFETDAVECNRRRLRSSQIRSSLAKPRSDTLLFRSASDVPDSILDWFDTLLPHVNTAPPPSHFDSKFSFSDKSSRPSTSTTRPPLPQSSGGHVSTSSSKTPSAVMSPALSIRSSHTGMSTPHQYSPGKPSEGSEGSPEESPTTTPQFCFPAPPTVRPPTPGSSSPRPASPTPATRRETILDRAFQMNCIPGASAADDKDGTMNSIARFEALMQEMEANRLAEHRRSSHALPEETSPTIMPWSAQCALDYISTGSTGPRRRSARSRPTSLALPLSSNRTSIALDDAGGERRRSSVSIARSSSTIAPASARGKRLSVSDFSHRPLSTSSRMLVRTGTGSSSRASWASDGSFGCSGEDERALEALPPKQAWRVSGAFGIEQAF